MDEDRGPAAGALDVNVLLAGVPVSDFEAALAWYRRFFGRPHDVAAHDEEVLWHVAASGWLYTLRDEARSGSATVTMVVPSLEAAMAKLAARGVATGPAERMGEAGAKAIARDPDGNSIALIEVPGAQ